MYDKYRKRTDKKEFLARIINLYGRFLDEKSQKVWIMSCNDVLADNVDYDRLWFYFIREFDTKTINNIPSCQWLYQASKNFLPPSPEPEKLPEGVPCPPEIRAKIKAIFERKSANF